MSPRCINCGAPDPGDPCRWCAPRRDPMVRPPRRDPMAAGFLTLNEWLAMEAWR